MLSSTLEFIQTNYDNLFAKGRVDASKRIASSGIEKFGWYASIVFAAGTIDKVKATERTNIYEWLNFLSIKKAEEILKQPI